MALSPLRNALQSELMFPHQELQLHEDRLLVLLALTRHLIATPLNISDVSIRMVSPYQKVLIANGDQNGKATIKDDAPDGSGLRAATKVCRTSSMSTLQFVIEREPATSDRKLHCEARVGNYAPGFARPPSAAELTLKSISPDTATRYQSYFSPRLLTKNLRPLKCPACSKPYR